MFSNKTLKEKVFNKHKEEPEIMPKSDAMAVLSYLEELKLNIKVISDSGGNTGVGLLETI